MDKPLPKKNIEELHTTYGDYMKITADIEEGNMVVGCELHADGEEVLLQKNSDQNNIWGGGIHLKNKVIDCTAVLNLRPSRGNPSIEILNPETREKFISVVKTIFASLWKN